MIRILSNIIVNLVTPIQDLSQAGRFEKLFESLMFIYLCVPYIYPWMGRGGEDSVQFKFGWSFRSSKWGLAPKVCPIYSSLGVTFAGIGTSN